jgi:N6-adenosine-specific RNA methylase IME4
MKYGTIIADPPWPYADAGRDRNRALVGTLKRDGTPSLNVATSYKSMTMPEICELRPPADDNAHLYLWTTNAFMVEAHEVSRAWGFKPKTILTWVKMQANGEPSRKAGYYFRGATEHIVFAVRGSLRLTTTDAMPTAFLWPRTQHSVKPEAFYDLVEQASPGPYLELFARSEHLGWDTWGNESLGSAEWAA